MIKKGKTKNKNQVKVTFILPADHPQPQASVVGDFNNWDPLANKLIKRNNQTYSCAIALDKNQRYLFRYVTADEEWFNEDEADSYEPNGHGSYDCVLET